MSRHIEESVRLENEYAKNQITMGKVKIRLRWFRLLLFYGNIVLFVFSIYYTYIWFSLKKFAFLYVKNNLDVEGNVIHFPIFTITLIIAPIFILMCILAQMKEKGIYLNIISVVSFVLLALCILNAFFGVEPVKLVNTIAFSVVMLAELIMSMRYVSAFSTMEILKTKDGYPDFNFSVSGVLTAEQQKYMDYYNARLKGEKVKSNTVGVPDDENGIMGELSVDGLKLPETSYEREDIRRKPL